MLNISENSIKESINIKNFQAFKILKKSQVKQLPLILIVSFTVISLACLFLPWTQNIQAKGYVTTRLPEQRPQAIQSVISGKLNRWYVKEGDYIAFGDTIAYITEVKSDYFDPDLIIRTQEQVTAKSQSVNAYEAKIKALQNQYSIIQEALNLKIEQTNNKIIQARNKIQIDSMDLVASQTNLQISSNQLSRTTELYNKGLKTLSELQEKELKQQAVKAKVVSQENKLLNQKNELANLFLELSTIEKEYMDKLAKSQSDRQSATSDKFESVAATSKLQNQLSNYNQRKQFYYITAPQAGYVTKTIKKGIGEVIKEGASIATIMPAEYDLAVEMYLKPQDIPLVTIGSPVILRFDGWPAIVISGWPESSTGVFDGKIAAIDQYISDNGYYRILVSPEKIPKNWPEQLRIGTGTNAFLLLKNVPIWYEMWRQLNGFPMDFYKKDGKNKTDIKRKAPLKSVK